jgi:WXXGXW repeat (2 copies)
MKKLLLFGTLLFGTLLAGCASNGAYAAVRFGPPPPPRYGVMGYAPGPGYVWTDGYWDWRGSRWFWVDGRWMRPPRRSAVWVPGVWVQSNHGYRFRRGYWR